MKAVWLILIQSVLWLCSSAAPPDSILTVPENLPDKDIPFNRYEELPSFLDGGLKEFRQWVEARLEWPGKKVVPVGASDPFKGRVIIRFIVREDGSVGDITVLQTPDKVFSDEVVRVVNMSPRWKPGFDLRSKKTVAYKYTLPVNLPNIWITEPDAD